MLTATWIYRFLIQILPAAVVAPLYFQGKIGFGVINQSSSAFNHILSDVSLVVYQVSSTQHTPTFGCSLIARMLWICRTHVQGKLCLVRAAFVATLYVCMCV